MIDADTFQVPCIQAVDTFVYLHPMMPPQAVQFAHICQFPQRAVRFRGIPKQFALESDFPDNFLSHFADAQFLARTYVDVAVADFLVAFPVGVLEACTLASAISSLHRNSRSGVPVPQRVTA